MIAGAAALYCSKVVCVGQFIQTAFGQVNQCQVVSGRAELSCQLRADFAAAYNALGYSFADRNIKLDEALQLIEKALSFSPNDHYMLDSLGWTHYRKGNLDKAEQYLQKAYAVNPDPEIAAHLGEVLWQKGQHNQAQKIWQEALSANPNNEVLLTTINKFKS